MSETNTIKTVTIAVDGPSASGKSTVSRLVAQRLGYYYVDTGAMYRTVTWKALREGVDARDSGAVSAMLGRVRIEFEMVDGAARMLVDGEYPGEAIRGPEVADHVSVVSAMPEVRRVLVNYQRSLTRFGNLVMEGRDIGSVVFSETPYKFYVDANPRLRAERRKQDFEAMKIAADAKGVAEALERRDKFDSSRSVAPLQVAPGAIVVDNSGSLEETVRTVLEHVERIRAGLPA